MRTTYPQASSMPWSTNLLPTLQGYEFNRGEHNIINFHWIGGGFVPISALSRIRKPMVWTLHDMCAFTGGCHYSGECTNYMTSCGTCPQLASSQQRDLSRLIWRAKHTHWQSLHFTVVSPSRWLADCARKSALFQEKRIEVIPYGIDTQLYHPMLKADARAQLGLPQDAKLLLFTAMKSTSDMRKGYHLLIPALHRLAQDSSLANLQLVVVGSNDSIDDALPSIPIHNIGYINDEHKLAALYSAADLSVTPSLEDNLPNTVMEALACGTPNVAFDIGGISDMIEHQVNGYLAKPFEVNDLADGMAWVLQDDARRLKLSQRARVKVEQEFSLAHQANRYMTLYRELIETNARSEHKLLG